MMVRLLSVAAALVMVAPAQLYAGDPLKHDSTATSTATVEVRPDGSVAMTARNVRLIPYVAFNPRGEPSYLPRLATVTTDVRTRSDAEGVDPASTVAVTIDDLSTPAPRRLASFTDPGSDGHLVDQRYFASIQFGCCGGVDRHVVHATETGHLLFRSTGEGEMGRVGWVDMPNARPAIVRWAAFDGDVAEGDLARGMLGILAYGGDDGPLATLEVRLKGSQEAIEEKNLELSSGADLLWLDGKHEGAKPGYQKGDAGSPAEMWIAEGAKSAKDVSGFTLALRLGRVSVAVIPVVADRLDWSKARLAAGYSLAVSTRRSPP